MCQMILYVWVLGVWPRIGYFYPIGKRVVNLLLRRQSDSVTRLLCKLSGPRTESYGPRGVLEKLHHWQFDRGELQGWDNAPFKYDDRPEGGEPAFFSHQSLTAESKISKHPLWKLLPEGQSQQL